jgi:hypothetical protein
VACSGAFAAITGDAVATTAAEVSRDKAIRRDANFTPF